MNLQKIQSDIYKLLATYNTFYNELPIQDEKGKDLDYLNNKYVTYSLGSINDVTYKNEINLEVQVVSNSTNSVQVQSLAIDIATILNKAKLTNSRIIKQNVWFIPITVDDKFYITLQFWVVAY